MGSKQGSVKSYFKMLLAVLLALLLRFVMVLPCLALVIFESGSPLRCLFLLCPVLLIFVVLPLRFSFAEELVKSAGGAPFQIKAAFRFSDYAQKLGHSLIHALKVLLWGIPMMALLGYLYYTYQYGENLALLQLFPKIGTAGLSFCYAIANFFLRIFGKTELVVPTNTMAEGLLFAGILLALALLIWLLGGIFCSGRRYLWALSMQNGSQLQAEYRQHLMGRRWAQLGNSLVNFLLVLPFLVVISLIFKSFFQTLYSSLMMMFAGVTPTFGDLTRNLIEGVCAFVFLYLTVLPIRRFRTAAFLCGKAAQKESAA